MTSDLYSSEQIKAVFYTDLYSKIGKTRVQLFLITFTLRKVPLLRNEI